MAHNFVLLAKGTDAAAFSNASATAATATSPSDEGQCARVHAAAGPGETVEVTFKAPAAPGVYTFVCSFPGHFLSGMKGALTVK